MPTFEATGDPVIPQANSLPVIVSVVDAIADGCLSAQTIAEAIGMVGRQGAYYPHAAQLLGLVEPVAGTSPVEWQLTSAGAAFVGLGAPARVDQLCTALSELGFLDTYVTEGPDGLAESWAEDSELGDVTISRRVATVAAWARFYIETDRAGQVKMVADAMTGTRHRAPGVRKAAAARQQARAPRAVRRCQHCFAEILGDVEDCELCS